MGKCFDSALRILLFVAASINFVTAVLLLNRRISMEDKEGREYIGTSQDYYVIGGIIVIPYLDFVLVWWGQHMRSSTQKACEFIF